MDLFPTYIHRFEIYDNDLVTQIIQHIKKQQEVSEAQKLEGSCNNVSGQYSVRGHGSFHSKDDLAQLDTCLLYTSPSPRDLSTSRMPSSA